MSFYEFRQQYVHMHQTYMNLPFYRPRNTIGQKERLQPNSNDFRVPSIAQQCQL